MAAAVGWALLLVAAGLGFMGYRLFHEDGPSAQERPVVAGTADKPAFVAPVLSLGADGTHTGPIEHGLAPYSLLWRPGGDDGEKGVSGALSREDVEDGVQATLDRLAATIGVPPTDAAEVMRQQGWDASAFRKYRGRSATADVRIEVTRMAPEGAKTANDSLRRATEPGTAPFPSGVTDSGAEVWCALRAANPDSGLIELTCGAVVGDIQVHFVALGGYEGSLESAAVLFREQVAHLRKGGAAA
ncbi:hypothetical protein [Yinghuangia sp. YIM S09857]|uniref:hypothetical protein n=1 Tax=Yinghuangia sp. YIM S09857 TaxID=3436929 RepID=UPI003F536C35